MVCVSKGNVLINQYEAIQPVHDPPSVVVHLVCFVFSFWIERFLKIILMTEKAINY